MSTSTALRPSVQAAFAALIDYAGLFPPAELPLRESIDEYRSATSGPHAWMLGRFIAPGSLLLANPGPLAEGLSVIVDASRDPRTWFGSAQAMLEALGALRKQGVRVEALEAPLPPLATQRETFDATIGQFGALLERAGLRDLPAYVELPNVSARSAALSLAKGQDDNGGVQDDFLRGAMGAAARAGLGVKIRCGGVTAQAFPSIDEVAGFITAAAEANVPFKATAGLHHPVRHLDPASGFVMHGFLNLLAAAALAPRVERDVLHRVIAEEDPHAFVFDETTFGWHDERVTVTELTAARTHGFVAYGSCSFSEPVDDLTALGILPKA